MCGMSLFSVLMPPCTSLFFAWFEPGETFFRVKAFSYYSSSDRSGAPKTDHQLDRTEVLFYSSSTYPEAFLNCLTTIQFRLVDYGSHRCVECSNEKKLICLGSP